MGGVGGVGVGGMGGMGGIGGGGGGGGGGMVMIQARKDNVIRVERSCPRFIVRGVGFNGARSFPRSGSQIPRRRPLSPDRVGRGMGGMGPCGERVGGGGLQVSWEARPEE